MPLSPRLAVAAHSFHLNSGFLKQGLAGLSDEEWLNRPCDHSNNILWIVGHMNWSRSMVLARLGDKWTEPWMSLFARGTKCANSPEMPNPSVLLEAWDVSGVRLDAAFENATEELLDTPAAKPGPPSADGMLSGVINFMALHETYHVGQASYVRSWLGKPSVMG